MIVELAESGGKSFKGLANYLLHDPDKAKTNERVAWTHTLNLAQDHPSLAVDEMLWTYRGADYLKREAGIKLSGRKLEYPVKHFSLNWHPSEFPSKTHMIETAEKMLKRLGWNEHQAVLVCHNDKPHSHIHVMLNVVHPQTGKALDNNYEKRRISDWARDYEFERGRIFCHQRVVPFGQREKTPTRDAWMRVQGAEREHARIEVERVAKHPDFFTRNDPDERKDREWIALKARQREQREQFFMGGKAAYRQVRDVAYRDVRKEFRADWRAWYADKRNGVTHEVLDTRKQALLKEQRELLDERVKLAFDFLRMWRDKSYAELRKTQEQEKSELRLAQKRGERSYDELVAATPAPSTAPVAKRKEPDKQPYASNTSAYHLSQFAENKASFSETEPDESGEKPDRAERDDRKRATPSNQPGNEHFRVKDGLDAVSGIGMGMLGAVAKIGERLMDGFFGNDVSGKAQTPQNSSAPPKRAMTDEERERVRRAGAAKAAAEAQATEAAALLADWEYRRQHRRARNRD